MISDIGSTDNTALFCITNLPASGGNSGGEWFAPDGDKVGSIGSTTVPGFGRNRGPMMVRLRSNDGTPEEGIYYCVVEDADSIPQTVYVGLYNSGGGNKNDFTCTMYMHALYRHINYTGNITLSGRMLFILDSDLNETTLQFTLTCISTGGPATTVTWENPSTAIGNQRSEVVDGVTAQYTHTLTVTGRLGGVYTCTVDNEVSPSNSERLTVQGTGCFGMVCVLQYIVIVLLCSGQPSKRSDCHYN